MSTTPYTLDADVLIIGGGSAGAMAAAWAKEVDPSQKVVVFEKGDIKYSGCIARGMDALNIVAVPGVSTVEEYMESIHLTCDGVVDDGPSHAMVSRSWELVQTLKDWGVYFPQDENGNYEVLKVHPKGRFALTMIEPELKTKLAALVRERGCRVVNRVMAAELLVDDGRVTGAIGLNVRTGEMVVCRAKSVILGAGGAARFGLPNSGYLYGVYDYPGNTGDGYMLAYRAGTELTGFEHTTRYYIVKDVNVPLLYIVLTRGARLLDALDEDITKAENYINYMIERHEAGRGPVRIRLSHLPEERIKAIEEILFTVERPVQERFHEGRGVNFRREDIELWTTDFFLCGGHGMTGVVVNERAEASVPGLYSAGDNACVPRGHLSGAFAFGQIAAENATAYAKTCPPPVVNEGQVRAFAAKLARLGERRGRVGVDECEYKVRRMITDYVTPPKNDFKLGQAQLWMERLSHDLAEKVEAGGVHDVFKMLEIENIIACAAVSAAAARERKESRWGTWHRRADYPQRDDANWLKHVICRRGEDDLDVRISHRPVQRMQSPVGA
ncbi:MAG: FAD-binding protein [Chloroflexota bacterium]